jgi:hypothetical protein
VRFLAELAVLAILTSPRLIHAQSEVQPLLAVHVLGAAKVALEGGFMAKPSPRGDWWPTATADVGLAGGQMSLGVARRVGPQVDYGGPGAEFTIRLDAAMLRTWDSPWYLEPRTTYGGAELTITLPFLVGLRAGAWHPLTSGNGSGWTAAFGLLVGWL